MIHMYEDQFLHWCEVRGWKVGIRNEGQHWTFESTVKTTAPRFQWWPSTGRLVINQNYKSPLYASGFAAVKEYLEKSDVPVFDHGVTIYTDGSCHPNPGPAGWAAVILSDNAAFDKFEVSGSFQLSTISRMELYAVAVGLEQLPSPCSVTIMTDSKYVRDMFEKGWLNRWRRNGFSTMDGQAVKNQDLIMRIDHMRAVHAVKIKWIPGHKGNRYNERADELAVAARRDQVDGLRIDKEYMRRIQNG